MKLKHWMESLSRGRKRSKTDNSTSNSSNMSNANLPSAKEKSRSKKLSVKELMMPHGPPREQQRKHVRDNYPAVAAYLDHRNPLSDLSQNLQSFRSSTRAPASRETRALANPGKQRSENIYVNVNSLQMNTNGIYALPDKSIPLENAQCACYRHQKERQTALDNCENSSSIYTTDGATSGSGTFNPRRASNVNIRTNPWIRPNQYSIMTDSTGSSSVSLRDEPARPVPPPKPQRKRPPPAQYYSPVERFRSEEDDDDTEMIVCSDKSVGTDGDEYLLDDASSTYCDCDECCSSSCHSFSSLKRSSAIFCSNETIQPDCDSDGCSTTSTPTILNDFIDADGETSCSERDSAVDSPASLKASCGGFMSSSMSFSRSANRPHYSPADSHTSWKYFDDDDEVDSGHGQTASSLGSPGSAEDYRHRISHSSSAQSAQSAQSAHSRQPLIRDDTRENFVDIDTNIEMIRTRLQKQVYQLKHEQTALDRQMFRSRHGGHYYGQEDNVDMIDEDFMLQKKAILVDTLNLLKRQLDEQNVRLQTSYSALQNLQKHQGQREAVYQPPRNRDHRALSALYNESIRETFC